MKLDFLALAIAAVWLLALSVTVFLTLRFFRRLVKGVKDFDLKGVLEKILTTQEDQRRKLEFLSKEVVRLDEESKFHVQRVGLVRFNPFKETGGDHSFSLALLDKKDTGVIVTGLHSRERTRVYMKAIKNGKCEIELSDEEKRALAKAQKS